MEGTVLSVLSSDDNATKLSLRVPCLIGPPPLMPGAGAIPVYIMSDWIPIYCDSGSVPCNASTDGANLWIYAPVRGVSVTPSKVSARISKLPQILLLQMVLLFLILIGMLQHEFFRVQSQVETLSACWWLMEQQRQASQLHQISEQNLGISLLQSSMLLEVLVLVQINTTDLLKINCVLCIPSFWAILYL